MNIRNVKISDLSNIMNLHEKFYNQFEQPSLLNMINAFIIDDDNGEMIMTGIVEKVAEAMLVTNKDKGEIKIGKALVEAKERMSNICIANNIRDLYAFVDNNTYAKHLIQHGFHESSNRALKLRVSHG